MKTLIVPTDFSPSATNAMNYATDMAIAIEASILLLHVYQVPVAFSEVPVVAVPIEEVNRLSIERLDELKAAINHITSRKINVATESRLGDVTEELEKMCKSVNPFAVVMGSRGTSAMERLFLGSNSLSVVRHLTCPVIVVPPGAEFKGIRKIGFACDFREVVASTPVPLIKKMVTAFGAQLHVLNVDFNNKNFKADTPEQTFLLQSMFEDLKPDYHFINDPDIEHGINEFAEKHNLDLIVTIPKKHKLLQGIFRPSSTKQLVFHSHIPILCVHE
jgi:nucleotide-binding universal stress UspA family protein